MKLNCEVARAYKRGTFVWRVRSTDNCNGDTCLALGFSVSESAAWKKAEEVRAALTPIFLEPYLSEGATP